ncbi:MAG TPA: hypothetical protein PLR28_00270 [Dokdonella sp.]|mgnify:CR=1 FL=1|uniref:hypothetical protein n=3 Tax=Dokdonella sp. TaxID=2291710 RepID=UPI002CB5A733|nr:hypothetical protein [Dokdonella sp.]HOX71193.1 hypothetical protein [Dokdonella sp.]HPG92968.1 hypothetical protein [Dokdonella sp.]
MRDTDTPNKTAAGRAEISARKLHLNPRQRTVLIAVNGNQSMQQIRDQFRVLGDVDAIIGNLHEYGLLELHGGGAVPAAVAPSKAVPATEPEMPQMPPLGLVRQFMNESSVAALGLRAFMFTLKLERCYAKDELLGLLPEYQRVLGKAKDPAYADAMTRHAREMLDAL